MTVRPRRQGDVVLTLIATTTCGLGVLGVALAFAASRVEHPFAEPLYWLGMATLVLPIVIAALSERPSRLQRLGLGLMLTVALFAVKVAFGPLAFAFHDELQHVRTAVDLMETKSLFTQNALLPISPSFPGLEIVTQALMTTSGASLVLAGTIVTGLAKLVLTAALFLLVERIAGSSQAALLAVLVYAANPHFTFFESMFAYATLALALMVLALYLLSTWIDGVDDGAGGRRRVPTLLVLAGLTVTHHVTTLVTIGLLAVWALASLLLRTARRGRPALHAVAFLAVAFVGWSLWTGADTFGYLGGPIREALSALGGEPGTPPPPIDRPLWEWLASAATVGVLALAIPIGARRLWRFRGIDAASVTFLALAATFYLGLAARFLPGGAELSGRSWGYAYLGAALTVAAGITSAYPGPGLRLRRVLALPTLALLFVGGVTLGYPAHWGRLPGPYLVSAFERSVDPQGIAAAQWTSAVLGPNNRIATDFTNATLTGSLGRQEPVRGVHAVYFAQSVGDAERRLLAAYDVRYLLVDMRLCRGLPQVGYYVVESEAGAYRYREPLACDRLEKFDGAPGLERRYDGGAIRVYRIVDAGEAEMEGSRRAPSE